METLRNSYLYAIYTAVIGFISRQWESSLLVTWLTNQKTTTAGAFGQLSGKLRRLYCTLFRRLHLPGLLQGSIFLHPGLYAGAAVLLAPLCPTLVVMALVCASLFSLLLKLGVDPKFQLTESPLNGYVLLYALIYLYETLTSTSVSGSLYPGLLTIAFVLFFFGVSSGGLTARGLRWLLAGMMAIGVVVSLYGFYQCIFPSQFRNVWTDTDMFSTLKFRVYSTLENPNVLGTYFLLVIPLSFGAVLTANTWPKRLLSLVAAGCMVLCLVLTYSRGCYLGLLFAAAVFLVLLNPKLLIPGVIALLLCPLYLPETVLSRFTSIGNMADTSTSYRVSIWLGTLDMLKDYWFCGIGPGVETFNNIYTDYAYNAVTTQHAHSLYLQIPSETGICGLVIFLVILVGFYRMMFSALRREENRTARVFQIAVVASVTGFLVQSATDHTFYNYKVMLLFWVMLALGVLFTQLGLSENVKEPCRILHIITDSNFGGAGRYLLNYLRVCDRERYDVRVVTPVGSQLTPMVQALDIPVTEVEGIADRSFSPGAISSLYQVIREESPQVVHTHGSLSGRIAGKLNGRCVVFTRHCAFPVPKYLRHGPGHWLNGALNSLLADQIIAVGPATSENLQQSGVPERKITVMMNGCEPMAQRDALETEHLRQKLGIPQGTFTAGLLARLEPYKGHDILLDAALELKNEGREFRILIAGAGSMEHHLEERIQTLGLQEQVLLLGFLPDVAPVLNILQVQLNCSYESETSSLSVIEGLSLGVPAVVSNCCGNPWLIDHGKSGLIFQNRDSRDLARQLRHLMDDPDLLRQLQAGALDAYHSRFTGEIFGKNMESVYQTIMEQSEV